MILFSNFRHFIDLSLTIYVYMSLSFMDTGKVWL